MKRNRFPKAYNLSSLKLLYDKKELVIPKVQRDFVWVLSQKQLLIDSILRDYDVPKIYFREIDRDNKTVYEVIDGQQRLFSVFGFLNDEFKLPNDVDMVNEETVANKCYSEFSSELQIEFNNRSLDIIILQGYTDEERDEMFLRLQNGTPLKAAEKRRAIGGNMRVIVEKLSQNKIFDKKYCDFDNSHYAYEDLSVKALKLIQEGGVTSISAQALKRMYENQKHITENDSAYKDTNKAYNFLVKAFKNTPNPHLKKYSLLDLSFIAHSLLNIYDISNYPEEFGQAYIDFSTERILNREKPEEEQDPLFIAYSNAARGDSIELMQFRQRFLKEYILEKMPYLEVKDSNRFFTADQRAVIYRLGKGVCAICGQRVSEEDFEADHKIPYAKGGKTQIANGQVLCSSCNHKKQDKTNFDY